MRIIVDAMGGDNAPESAVWGGALAAKEYGEEVLLVGKPEVVANVLEGEGTFRGQGHYHHACNRSGRYARRSRQRYSAASRIRPWRWRSSCSRPARATRSFPRATPARCSRARRCIGGRIKGIRRACAGTGYARAANGQVMLCDCGRKHRMHRRNAAAVRVPRLAVCGEDQRCRQARASALSTTARRTPRAIRSARRLTRCCKRRATRAV